MTKTELTLALQDYLQQNYATSLRTCTKQQAFCALMHVTKTLLATQPRIVGDRKVYYFSAEFLIGKLLSNNLLNLHLYDTAKEIFAETSYSLADLEELELEPSLGNGGLGRLAACFLDSIATLGLPGDGIGLNYHFGLFEQVFQHNKQTARKNEWLGDPSWLTKTDITFPVTFGTHCVTSRLYDLDVAGYNGGINKLHLFDIETIDETIVKDGITFDKTAIDKNLTLFLYPDDSDKNGELLRIYQQYFMVSNGVRLILHEAKAKGIAMSHLHKAVAIQINDTHPALVIPELIRVLTQEEGVAIDTAIAVVEKTCAYTNHTILAEALEKWPIDYLKTVVPQLVPIIELLDERVRARTEDESVQIIDAQKRVHMAHMAIHYGYSINGVAALHTEILKQNELHAFYKLYPEKFNNKTNGITFRRWLLACNPELTALIKRCIGDGFQKDATELKKLLEFQTDSNVLEALVAVKKAKKAQLAQYIAQKEGVGINPNSIFDVQIKRLHEYKRQQMNVLYIIHKYLEIKQGIVPTTPITFIFGAKAAPAYTIAQDIIHLILVLQNLIENDPQVKQHITVLMVENYNVTYAEKLIPASDISEQISLASKEASGTGNMKFMLNGAITLGTADGANVEIHQLVGDDNIYMFGKSSQAVIDLYATKGYCAKDFYDTVPCVKKTLDFIISEAVFALGDKTSLTRLYNELLGKDWFMTLLDLEEYIAVKDAMLKDYEDASTWRQKMLVNIANAGFFSSDRTIAQYNADLWHLS